MAVPTVADFVRDFPEFAATPVPLVQAKLDLATSRTDATAWGDLRAAGIMQRTADLLAKTPEGRRLRLMLNDETSIYAADLRAMVRSVSYGRGRVT